MSTSVTDFINCVFAVENILKKVLPVSTVYAFKTYGNKVKAHGMFLFSPLKQSSKPVSTAHYLLDTGEVLTVLSVPAHVVTRVVEKITQKTTITVLILDFYNPPCVIGLRKIGDCASLINKMFLNIVQKLPQDIQDILMFTSVELETSLEETALNQTYAYLIFKSYGVDTNLLFKVVSSLVLTKLLIEQELSCDEYFRYMESVKKVVEK